MRNNILSAFLKKWLSKSKQMKFCVWVYFKNAAMLMTRKGVITSSLSIKEANSKHRGIFHYINFMMWHSLPLPVFPIMANGIFIFPVAQANPVLEWSISFLLLLQPAQSETTFISSFRIRLQANFFLPPSPRPATLALMHRTLIFHQDCCSSFLVSGWCPCTT